MASIKSASRPDGEKICTKEPTLKITLRETRLATLLIGLVSDRWQGDRLKILPYHDFTREDVQELASRLMEFQMMNCPERRD